MAFAFGWTPCIGPVLGSILAVAAGQDGVGRGGALLAVYSLGVYGLLLAMDRLPWITLQLQLALESIGLERLVTLG